ncbi:MAG: glycosyltransferase [Candidatus Pacearchaeota archaeon]
MNEKGKKFSIVIPVAPERGAEILRSIMKLDYPKEELQIIVAKGKNPSENRNKGAERSKGRFIVFLDDDAVLENDYLKKVEEFFDQYKDIDIVGGPQLTPKDDKEFAKISGYALSSKFGAWKTSNRYSSQKIILNADETMLTSANLICKREVLDKVRFDTNLFPGEDPKFISEAKEHKFQVAYSPDIVIYHRRRDSPGKMFKQIFNYGKTRPLKENFTQTIKMPFFFIPSIFCVYLVLLLIGILINPNISGKVIGAGFKHSNLIIFLPLFLYLFAALIFAIYDSIHNKDYKAIFVLPFVYLLIHISYGSGMIYGYIKKITKK